MKNPINQKLKVAKKKRAGTAVQTAAVMAFLTIFSKALGFARELIVADTYGTSYISDAYAMAQGIPDFFIGGIMAAIGSAFLPIFSEVMHSDGENEANHFTNQVSTIIFLVSGINFLVCFIFAEPLVHIFAPGFSSETTRLTVIYLRLMLACPLIIGLTSIYNSYLQYKERFISPILSGWFLDIGIIVVVFISAKTSHYLLGAAFTVGYFLYFLSTVFLVRNEGYHFKLESHCGHAAKRVFALALPVFISSSASSINTFVDRALSASLPVGSLSAIHYGIVIMTTLAALTTSVIGTILFPKITKAAVAGNWTFFDDAVKRTFTVTFLIALPLSLGSICFAEQVVQILFERGAFSEASTELTSGAFRNYAYGQLFLTLNLLLTKIYFALHDTRSPMLGGLLGVVLNIGLNFLLVGPMAHCGLALATSISIGANSILLLFMLKKKCQNRDIYPSLNKILKISLAAILSVALSVCIYNALSLALSLPEIVYLCSAVLAAVVIYLLLLKLFKIEELSVIKELLRRN